MNNKNNYAAILSSEKARAIASELISNGADIKQYVEENDQFYREYLYNQERELEVPITPIHLNDL